MTVRNLTCINCPFGCQLKVSLDGNKVLNVEGNTCARGKRYAENEVMAPKRTVTSTVKAGDGRVAVKTVPEIPKDMIFQVMDVIHMTIATPPVRIGDVLVKDIAGTGSDLVVASEKM